MVATTKSTNGARLWNANYCKVMAANFALFFSFYLLTPLLPLYLSTTFDAGKDTIGLVLSGYTVMAFCCRPLSGYIVDSFDRKRVLMLFYALFFILFAGYLAATTLLWFAVVRTIHGGPYGALTVANSTMAIDVLPSERRNEGIGYYGLSNNLAMAMAPTIALFIYHHTLNFNLLFWIALIVAGTGMAIDATVRPRKRGAMADNDAKTTDQKPKRCRFSLDRFFLLRGWLLALNLVFFGFCFGVLSNYLAIYSHEVLGRTGGTGTYFALLSVGLIASRLQGGKGLRKGLLARNAAEGVMISSIGYTCFALFRNDAAYYASALLIGLGNGHMWPAFQNMMINIAEHNRRGTANSTTLVSWDVGMGIGVLLGGVIAEHLGYKAAFGVVAAMQVAGTVLYYIRTRGFFEERRLR